MNAMQVTGRTVFSKKFFAFVVMRWFSFILERTFYFSSSVFLGWEAQIELVAAILSSSRLNLQLLQDSHVTLVL